VRQNRRQATRQDHRQTTRQDTRQQNRATARRVTAQQARQGRFAALARANGLNRVDGRRVGRRVAPWGAWRHGWHAGWVPWYGSLFWPYAYTDLFFFTFWPYAYDPGYWAYAYDDFFDGVFFPYGSAYDSYASAGPVGPYAPTGRHAVRSRTSTPGAVSPSVQKQCAEQASGVAAWPFDRIEAAVKPTNEQQDLLTDLKRAADQAGDRLKETCPQFVPMTPTGRLEAMTQRLQATLDAVKLVRPPLEKFYRSLGDEQQARFNSIGPRIGRKQQQQQQQQAACSGDKAGLTALPIERIHEVVQPTGQQSAQIDALRTSIDKAVQTLENACPDYIPQTPVGRMEVMQKRLEAMIEAANTVKPPLDDFYASLSSEQKARFNTLRSSDSRQSRR
jgi:hypothetical protein